SGSSDDFTQALAVDANGNVFVTGNSRDDAGRYRYATIGYSSEGIPLWTNCYGGLENSSDFAAGTAVDGSGNVFVTGESIAGDGSYEIATIKYSGAGFPLW